ncbi:MAG TPA: hypothetical protein VNW06_01745 [Cytophagaceae bacterium]|jgi:hypothetical protein|nr:hypothetical protein [Cytophagaceae bacterium]
MKKIKIFAIIIIALSTIGLLYAQRDGGGGYHGGSGGYGGGYHGGGGGYGGGYHGGGDHDGGGYHGGGDRDGGGYGGYHGGGGYRTYNNYNNYGYAARPYCGVSTGPIGYGYGYGYSGYGGPRCGYVGYWHQWTCW